jgi:hypothetical protein
MIIVSSRGKVAGIYADRTQGILRVIAGEITHADPSLKTTDPFHIIKTERVEFQSVVFDHLPVTDESATLALASTCTNNGPYSFRIAHETTYMATIYAYRGSGCRGDYISFGRAFLSGSDIILYAYDADCDSTGLTIYTSGGYSRASTGCGTVARTPKLSRSLTGDYFWVEVRGYVSPLYSIPI